MFSVDRRPKPFCATLRAKRYAEPFACGIGLINAYPVAFVWGFCLVLGGFVALFLKTEGVHMVIFH